MNKNVIPVCILLSMCAAGCATTTSTTVKTPLVLKLGSASSQEVIKPENKFIYRAYDHFIILDEAGALRLLKQQNRVCERSPFSKRFCPNGFPDQPQSCNGAIQSVFLSDSRIDALKNVTVTVEKTGPLECCTAAGSALALNICE